MIMLGIVIVKTVVVLTVFISRAGLFIEIIQRDEGMGTMQIITVRLSNNNSTQ